MLFLIPVMLPVLSGTIILIKKWKKKPWRRPRFILISAFVNSAVVLGFLIAQYSETLKVTITGNITFWFALDGLGSIFAGCMAVLIPVILCFFLDPGEEREKVQDPIQTKPLRSHKDPEKRKADTGKERTDAQKAEGKRDIFSASFNYLFAAMTGFALSKNAATMSFFFLLILLITAWMVQRKNHPGKWYWMISGIGTVAVLPALAVAVFGGKGAAFYFDGYLSGNISETILQLLYILGFCGCSVRALVYPIAATGKNADQQSGDTYMENLLLDTVFAFVLIRLTFSVFGISLLRGTWVQVVMTLVSVTGILVHAVLALREKMLQKKISNLSAASFALILIGISALTSHGYAAAVWMMACYVAVQLLLILVLEAVKKKGEIPEETVIGMGRRMPVTSGCYVAACLSICAFPPLAGFLSVWKISKALIHQGGLNYLSLAAMFFFLFLAVLSLYPTVGRAFFPKNESAGTEKVDEVGLQMLVPMVVLAAAVIAVGFFSGALGDYIYQIGLGLG